MLRFALPAALLLAAAPALAQPAGGGTQVPPEIQQSAMAFGQCVGTGLN